MADAITVRGDSGYAPAPEGQFAAVCVDIIDMGERVESYQGGTPKLTRKVVLVFQIDEENPDTGARFEPSVEKTLAFGPTAGLRKFLSQWRGKAYTDAEASAGVPLEKLVGVNGILQIEHKQSAQGRTYAKISNIMPPMKNVGKIQPDDYQRSEHWNQRRADYAEEVQLFRATRAPVAATAVTRNGQPAKSQEKTVEQAVGAMKAGDDDDGLPF